MDISTTGITIIMVHYRRTHEYRYPHYTDYYYSSRRVQSPVVIVKIQKGNYRSTYSRPDQRKAGEELVP